MGSMTYADATKGNVKSVTWKRKLAKKAVIAHDKHLIGEIEKDLIK